MDSDDNHVARFLTYLIAALAEADTTIVPESAELIAGMEQLAPVAVLTTLINNLEIAKTEIALVLDDYQFIDSEAVHKSMTFLLEHCPNSLHIMILQGRTLHFLYLACGRVDKRLNSGQQIFAFPSRRLFNF